MRPPHWTLTGVAIATWVTAVGALVFGNACSSVNPNAISDLSLPDKDQFITQGVDVFMEKKCGALDCHGQVGRALRIYSQNGLRMKDGDMSGARDTRVTTPEELSANYYSVVGLEPEEISKSNISQGNYTDFLLLKKPLDIEGSGVRHKGGPVIRSTDPGFECIITWISGMVSKDKCDAALMQ
jgi:hypothetical protein